MSLSLVAESENRLDALGASRAGLATAGPGLLRRRAWRFLGPPTPEAGCPLLQVLHGGQQPGGGSLGWGPSRAFDGDSQVIQGEGFPPEPGGPVPEATPGPGAWLCVPISGGIAQGGPEAWAGRVCGQKPGRLQDGGWLSLWPWGSGASPGHPVRPKAFLRLRPGVGAAATSTRGRAGLPCAQVTLLDGGRSRPPQREGSQGLEVALLLESRVDQPAGRVLQGKAQAGPRAGQVGLDLAGLLAKGCPRRGSGGRLSSLSPAPGHPLARSTTQDDTQALWESPLL